jgi:protein-L-isoaspartate O-methyltransferase
MARHVAEASLPTPPEESCRLCEEFLPQSHAVPRFFRIRSETQGEVGRAELQAAYDSVHEAYDEFWLKEASRPIDALVAKMRWRGDERAFEAGCGTGYATALLASRAGSVLAADLSEGMLAEARSRLGRQGRRNVRLVAGDALDVLAAEGPFDVVFSSWVLGYILLKPFFAAAAGALAKGGQLAFVVHKENSPREPLEIFAELVARDPSVLLRRVAFDFPRDGRHVRSELDAAGLEVAELWEGTVVFCYDRPEGVLEHLLKSGAGTAFYDAVDPGRREALMAEFVERLAERQKTPGRCEVRHDYVACLAAKG